MKVLITDDSTTMLKIIKNTLIATGIDASDIFEAQDGQEAYTKYKLHSPDLILTDWNMPVMNGLEFVKKLRLEGSITPIVMVTTEAQKSDVVLALKTGANDYITKPFTPNILKDKIDRFLS
jgi:two-component system chemotaxis response regulator CheY